MSRVWRQTISDELAAVVDAQRGALTMQEYTTFALAGATQLLRRIEDLERQVARVAPAPPPAAPVACASVEMLSF